MANTGAVSGEVFSRFAASARISSCTHSVRTAASLTSLPSLLPAFISVRQGFLDLQRSVSLGINMNFYRCRDSLRDLTSKARQSIAPAKGASKYLYSTSKHSNRVRSRIYYRPTFTLFHFNPIPDVDPSTTLSTCSPQISFSRRHSRGASPRASPTLRRSWCRSLWWGRQNRSGRHWRRWRVRSRRCASFSSSSSFTSTLTFRTDKTLCIPG